jgi:hypothetical protein
MWRIFVSEVMERSSARRAIDTIYIDGAFVTPHGDDRAPQFNPATEKQIEAAVSTIVEMTMADFHGQLTLLPH